MNIDLLELRRLKQKWIGASPYEKNKARKVLEAFCEHNHIVLVIPSESKQLKSYTPIIHDQTK